MDKEKEGNLRNHYKEITDQHLLDMLSEDEKSFEDGAYALLVEEAKRRRLEIKPNEVEKNIKEETIEEKHLGYKFINIFTTPRIGDLPVIKSILESEKIPYYIKGENFGTLYGQADGLTAVDIMVRDDYVDYVKTLLKDFILPASSKGEEGDLLNKATAISKERNFVMNTILSVALVLFIIHSFTLARNNIAKKVFVKGYHYAEQGEQNKAILEFNKVIKINPNLNLTCVTYINRGISYQNQGNLDQALSDFNEAIKIAPEYADAYYWRGGFYMEKKDYDQAILDYKRVIELKPNNANAYFNRGYAYSNKNNYDLSIFDYTKAIELKPDFALAYNNRGYDYFLKGEYMQTISDCTHAIELEPKLALAYYNRGLAYYYEEQYDKALIDYTQAVKLEPDKESYEEFMKFVPEKRATDTENVREKILELFK